jgi:hypothetical protein
VQYHARNADNPSLLADVIDATLAATRPARADTDRSTLTEVVRRAVYARTVEALLALAANGQASTEVRAIAYAKLDGIRRESDSQTAIGKYLSHRIEQFQRDPARFTPASAIEAPPGMPIGDDESPGF